MRKHSYAIRLAFFAAAAVPLAVPLHVEAQRRPQNLDRVLILPPLPRERAQDSAYALTFANEIRDHLAGRTRNQVQVVQTDQYCEALEASGFPCDILLDNNSAEQLARFLNADAYVIGELRRNSTPAVHLRMIDLRRSGLAGWVHVEPESNVDAERLANLAGDSIRDYVRAADRVKDCSERRDRSDFSGARSRAQDVFEDYPNHPGAAMCLSYVFEAQQAPADSLIWAYRKAVAGDSLLERAWERLGQQLLFAGDTAGAIESFQGQLNAKPENEELRIAIASQMIVLGDYQGARDLAEQGLEINPSMQLLVLKARACSDGEMWPCALEAFNQQYEANTELAQDTAFLQQVIGAAGFAQDPEQAVRWTRIALDNFPDRTPFWMAHGSALRDAGMPDSALQIHRTVAEREPENTRAPLAMAQIVIERVEVDSAIPLDTASVMLADSLLQSVALRAMGDSATLRTVGALYVTPGLRMGQARLHSKVAVDWLAKALEQPIQGTVRDQANFFLAFSTLLYLGEFFNEVRDSESCELAEEYARLVTQGQEALEAGASVAPTAVPQIEERLQQLADIVPRFRQAFQCTSQ